MTLTGRALDEAVQTEIIGHRHTWNRVSYHGVNGSWWRCLPCCVEGFGVEPPPSVPDYSTNITAAWLVLKEMRRRGFRFTLEELEVQPPWVATFSMSDIDGMGGPVHYYESGETAMEAIARAALAACRSMKEASP